MREITAEYAADAMNAELIKNKDKKIKNVAIDSRKTDKDSLFFAIIGNVNNAHKFLPSVYESGCRNVVVSDEKWAKKLETEGEANVFVVDDTTRALMNLAKKYLSDWGSLIKIGVTGSVGKTSTKEFIAAALSKKYKVGKTKGNLNSEYGVPLTIFDFERDIEVAVIEMGIGDVTKMSDLQDIVLPDAAVITNIGTSHLEAYGSREELAREKLKIASSLSNKDMLVINGDNDILGSEHINILLQSKPVIIKVGCKEGNKFRITDICDNGIEGVKSKLIYSNEKTDIDEVYELHLKAIGAHNLINAAEAIAVAYNFGISIEDAINAVSETDINTNGQRLNLIEQGGISIINDTYNASPDSMMAGIRVLMNSASPRHVAILGDMFELGNTSAEQHRMVGEFAADEGLDLLVTIGDAAIDIASGARDKGLKNIVSYASVNSALKDMKSLIKDGDLVLVKASRGMKLERIVEELR